MKKVLRNCIALLLFASPIMISCGGNGKAPKNNNEGIVIETGTSKRIIFEISDSVLKNKAADTLSFGRVREGEVATKNVAIRNSGDKPMVIVEFIKTCGCIGVEYHKKPILPGEEADLSFSFDSKGITGWSYKTILMQTSLDADQHLFIITAEVIPSK